MDGRSAVATVAVGLVVVSGLVAAPGGAVAPAPDGRAPVADGVAAVPGPATPTANGTDRSSAAPPDPAEDVLGWEAGYWHDEAIDVDRGDGLDDAEMDALVARSMARVEYLRRLEFEAEVPVRVVPRSTLSGSLGVSGVSEEARAWHDQVWEALFVVGEDRDATAAFRDLTGAAVLGFYSPQRDRIVVVAESADRPVVDNATLVHELVHALQDQHFGLGADRLNPRRHDAALAADALVEGDAGYVEALYARRCRQGTWDCVPPPPGGDPEVEANRGLHATLYQPYSDGPPFVADIVDRSGWDAVNALYADPPATTERVLHPDAGSEAPTPLRFEDRGRDGWTTFLGQGVDGAETVGEATIYAMFWYQGDRFGVDAVPWRSFERPDAGPFDTYDYTTAASAGWGNDRLVPYRRGESGDHGYVWTTAWDTERDAREFRRAYLRVLRGHGAEQRGPATWVVPDGPFADAFRVRRTGRTVTVVNGPTVAAVDDIRPGLARSGDGAPTNASAAG